MNSLIRLRKEAHALFWPWCLVMLVILFPMTEQGWLADLPSQGLLLGSMWLAALSFGDEFRLRTLPLWLSQPCSRRRLWAEKMLVRLVLLLAVVLASAAHTWFIGRFIYHQRLTGRPFPPVFYDCMPLVCTIGFWTLLSRSTLGGMAFSLVAWGAWSWAILLGVGRLTPTASAVADLGYALLFLWLGWRKFARLELNTADQGEDTMGATVKKDASGSALLRCRARSPLTNLVRKELRLLQPLLVLALLFALFWLALAWLVVLLPGEKIAAGLWLEVVISFYLFLGVMLAGCRPLSEERAQGLYPASLTLPVAVRTQVLLKLTVALVASGLAVYVLPGALAQLTAGTLDLPPPTAFLVYGLMESWEFPLVLGLLGLLGLWGAAITGRFSTAVLLVIVTTGALFLALTQGTEAGGILVDNNDKSIVTVHAAILDVVTWLAVHCQFSARGFSLPSLVFWLSGAVVLVAGIQAWRAFRVPLHRAGAWVQSLAGMLLAIALAAILGANTMGLAEMSEKYMEQSSLVMERRSAFQAFMRPLTPSVSPQLKRSVTLAELEATGKLSAQTKTWLQGVVMEARDGVITHLEPVGNGYRPEATREYELHTIFPNGSDDYCSIHEKIIPP